MDPLLQGLNEATERLLEVKLENIRDESWVMEEGIRADVALLRAKEIEYLVLMREKERLQAVLQVGEKLANAFFQLEADGKMNFDYQNAMKEAIDAWVVSFKSFGRIHANRPARRFGGR